MSTSVNRREFMGVTGSTLGLSLTGCNATTARAAGPVAGPDIGDSLLVSPEEDRFLSNGIDDNSDAKSRMYMDLKDRGWLVRTGFKYGAHFRVYTSKSPEDHPKFLVHNVDENKMA